MTTELTFFRIHIRILAPFIFVHVQIYSFLNESIPIPWLLGKVGKYIFFEPDDNVLTLDF